jgi:hypothetical protein
MMLVMTACPISEDDGSIRATIRAPGAVILQALSAREAEEEKKRAAKRQMEDFTRNIERRRTRNWRACNSAATIPPARRR